MEIQSIENPKTKPRFNKAFVPNLNHVALKESAPKKSLGAGMRRMRCENVLHAIRAETQKTPSRPIDIILEYGNNPEGIPALESAIMHGDIDAVRLLLEHGEDPNSGHFFLSSRLPISPPPSPLEHGLMVLSTPLDFAAVYGDAAMIHLLCDFGAEVNPPSMMDGQVLGEFIEEMMAELLDLYDNLPSYPLATEADPLPKADSIDWDNVVGALVQRFSPLHFATFYGKIDAMKALLERDANLNYSSKERIAPFQVAVSTNNVAAAQLLFDRGADIHQRTGDDKTALHIAATFPAFANPEMLSFLVSNGIEVNAKNCDEETAFHVLCQKCRSDLSEDEVNCLINCIQILLDAGAEINAQDECNDTPLFYVRNDKIREYLIDRGAQEG